MNKKTPSLQAKAIDRILVDMIKSTNNLSNDAFTVLIIDKYTTPIISSYITMSELLNSGIFSVEPLDANRKSFASFNAIYFVSPSQESCKKIVEDFADQNNPKYNNVHLFFPFRILDSVIEIFADKNIAFRIKSMKELNLAFFSNENIFSISQSDALQTFSFQSSNLSNERRKKLTEIKNKMMTVFASMKEYPFIQYQNNQICSDLADLLKGDLNELSELKVLNKERNTICLIVDRSIDLTTPVLHDFSYKSMVYDLFNVDENDILNSPSEKIEGHKLDEKDEYWVKYKNMHLGYVLRQVKVDLQEYLDSDLSKTSDKNLDDFDKMRKALENRTANKDKSNRIGVHLKICEKLQKLYSEYNLSEIIELEQKIITGVDSQGKKIENKDIFKEYAKVKIGMNEINKQRLLFAIASSIDITESDFKTISSDMDKSSLKHIDALKSFNLFFSDKKSNERRKSRMTKDEFNQFQKQNNNEEFTQLRSSSEIEDIVEKCCNNSLDFPFVHKPEGFFNKNKNYIASNLRNLELDNEETEKRIVLFVIGGISINEIIAIENFNKSSQKGFKIIIGSTSIFSPNAYVKELSNIKSEADIMFEKDEIKLKEIKLDIQTK